MRRNQAVGRPRSRSPRGSRRQRNWFCHPCGAALWIAFLVHASSIGRADDGAWRVADPGTIATDRPGNGNVPTTVPTGYLNVESSFLYSLEQGQGASNAVSFPVALRLGLLPPLELRLLNALVGIDKRDGRGAEVDATDLVAGSKLAFLRGEHYQPDVGLSVDVSFPTGGGAFNSDVVVPEARFLLSQPLPKGFGLLFNLGFDTPVIDGDRFGRFVYVGHVNYRLPVFAERWSFFVEGFGRIALTPNQPDIIQIDAGTAFLFTRRLQIDFFSQHGLSEAAIDHQFSIGFSAML